jgi:hypothetical protein
MGSLPEDEVLRRAADIEEQADRIWAELPDFLKMDNEPWGDLQRAPVEFLYLTWVRLSEYNWRFLLQRTLIKKVGADSTKLLSVSREMFKFFLFMINHRDIFRDFQLDFTQLLTMGGVPAASVIAVELLHQEQDPTSFSALNNPLPRSDTIQDLSVLVACLSTVKPNTRHDS